MNSKPEPDARDSQLIASAKAGDREAISALYRRYVDPVYRYLLAHIGNPADAEDLTEDTFLRSFSALNRYQDRGWPFSAYLYRVAKNVLFDHNRRNRAKFEISLDSEPLVTPAADEGIARSELLQSIRDAMETLPGQYREVIILRIFLSLTTAEAASWMNQSEGSIRVLLFRALKSLRQKLRTREP
jgi:RNA polymerase sigma-70 factor (ECF subfamily)